MARAKSPGCHHCCPFIAEYNGFNDHNDHYRMRLTGFHFGMFVNTTGRYLRQAEPTPTDSDNFRDSVDFAGEAKMSFDVHLPGNALLHSLMTFRNGFENDDNTSEVEKAYVAYDPVDWMALKFGRFRRWFVQEHFDAPDLWRISSSYTRYTILRSMNGAGIYLSPEQPFTVGLFVVDEIITPDDPATTKSGADMGYGVSFRAATDHSTLYKLDAYLDTNTATSFTNKSGKSHVWRVHQWIMTTLPIHQFQLVLISVLP